MLLETYLRELREIRATGAGVDEESYYHPLATLLNEAGGRLKPKVCCILQLANRGAGEPDGGFFTADQFEKGSDAAPLPGQLPSRGAIEIKPTYNDAWVTAEARQVTKYWKRYRQVLVTNYRDFVLVGQDVDGNPAILETYSLAGDERQFWEAVTTPRKTNQEHGPRFIEFLQRVMLHPAPLSAPEDVAWFLASYARAAKTRIEGVELAALASVRAALEEALGLKFVGEKGEHFFRSSLVQTLFYGIFSAWVLWSRHHPGGAGVPPALKENGRQNAGATTRFDWRLTAWSLRVPMISRLFSLVADPRQLDAMKLSEVLDWTGAVLNRVDRAAFFSKFEETHAVQYFYEPFLEAFDPELRKQLGVWYTPPEIVKYMVERVDRTLRQELGLPLGLADKNVYVLDPCCGTGSYLVAVLDRIHRTLKERGEDALIASDLKEAARKRVFGFEILPAPFVVSHLQLGLLLERLGAPLSENRNDRGAVYLTNALTGWEPPKGPKQHLMFLELEEERDAAEHVKQQTKILVVLGNPPYNGFAGVAVEEERVLTDAYRTTKRAPAPHGQGLNDLYVRFYRMAERRIVEMSGQGVVCFISNYSWLDGLSFTGMRERYLDVFDRIWIDCLNGDKYKTGKLTPEGDPDPSVFSTEFNPEGIQVGTAIALLVRCQNAGVPVGSGAVPPSSAGDTPSLDENSRQDAGATPVRFRNVWGKTKRQQLVTAAERDGRGLYEELIPPLKLGLPFAPANVGESYLAWPLLPDLFPVSFPGVKTSRDELLVDIDRDRLILRMKMYFDPRVSHDEMRRACPSAMASTARFDAEAVRDYLRNRGFREQSIVKYCYRPFDVRWLYWEPETKLLDEKRSGYFPEVFWGNLWIEARQKQPMEDFDRGYVVRVLADNFGNGLSSFFPMLLSKQQSHRLLGTQTRDGRVGANLSDDCSYYVQGVGAPDPDVFFHAVAVLHAPGYRKENASALRQDWPRIPLPDSKELLLASAALGRKVAALLDTETPFDPTPPSSAGVPPALDENSRQDAGATPDWLRHIAAPARIDGKPLNDGKDLAVTAGWGHAGKGGVTMPGGGRLIARDDLPEERNELLGDRACDVYLNGVAYWKNVPIRVWEYKMGGYQVIKKWLSYREEKLLGRPLHKGEVRWVQEMARRIAAILLLEPALDSNYRNVKEHVFHWKV